MGHSDGVWERAMKIQEVILRALSGEIHWFQAAEILGFSVRTMRRYRAGLEKWGYEGLFDHRRRTPSPRSVPVAVLWALNQAPGAIVPGLVIITLRPRAAVLGGAWRCSSASPPPSCRRGEPIARG